MTFMSTARQLGHRAPDRCDQRVLLCGGKQSALGSVKLCACLKQMERTELIAPAVAAVPVIWQCLRRNQV